MWGLVLSLALVILSGCLGQVKVQTGVYELVEGSSISISDDMDYTLKVDSIWDSRCPVDVTCITAGSAVAKIQLFVAGDIDFEQNLCLGECLVNSLSSDSELIIGASNYYLKLVEVTPIPTENNGSLPKTATVELIKAQD